MTTTQKPKPIERYYVGVDLGQSTDYSTLAALRQSPGKDAQGRTVPHYALVHLHRWERKTSYVQIGADIGKMFEAPKFAGQTNPLARAVLVVDRSGCGRPVYDSLLAAKVNASAIIGLTITAGATDSVAGVAKRNLVSGLLRLFGEARLQIASSLKLAPEFLKELEAYKLKVTASRNETFGAASGAHDDLVSCVAIACHWAERQGLPSTGSGPGTWTPKSLGGFDIRGHAALRQVDAIVRGAMK